LLAADSAGRTRHARKSPATESSIRFFLRQRHLSRFFLPGLGPVLVVEVRIDLAMKGRDFWRLDAVAGFCFQ